MNKCVFQTSCNLAVCYNNLSNITIFTSALEHDTVGSVPRIGQRICLGRSCDRSSTLETKAFNRREIFFLFLGFHFSSSIGQGPDPIRSNNLWLILVLGNILLQHVWPAWLSYQHHIIFLIPSLLFVLSDQFFLSLQSFLFLPYLSSGSN
jgi:hypothetical protein